MNFGNAAARFTEGDPARPLIRVRCRQMHHVADPWTAIFGEYFQTRVAKRDSIGFAHALGLNASRASIGERPVKVFPSTRVLAALANKYQTSFLQGHRRRVTEYDLDEDTPPPLRPKKKAKSLDEKLSKDSVASFLSSVDESPEGALREARRFREILTATSQVAHTKNGDEPTFEEMLTIVGSYPELARQLGLVVDFVIPMIGPNNVPSTGNVRVDPRWTPEIDTVQVLPSTRYIFDQERFQAAPCEADGYIHNGMLDLSHRENGEPCFKITQLDAWAESVHAEADSSDSPTMKSVGVILNWTCLGENLERSFAKSKDIEVLVAGKRAGMAADSATKLKTLAPGPEEARLQLFAEDLVRGYRVDVMRMDKPTLGWLSLCKRVGHYFFQDGSKDQGNSKVETLDLEDVKELSRKRYDVLKDEGWVSIAGMDMDVSLAGKRNIPNALGVLETIVKWGGWSLCAPRPGKAVNQDGQITNPNSWQPESLPFYVHFFAARRSLPTLRFGVSYQMRVRLVDLAGNSLLLTDMDTAADQVHSSPFVYGRFEAVGSPLLALREPIYDNDHKSLPGHEGETLFDLVIRSNYNKPARRPAERWIAPPRVSELFAEMHGVFDDTKGLKTRAYDTIVSHDGALEEVYTQEFYLPYLPDPLASKVLIHNLPGTDFARPPCEEAEEENERDDDRGAAYAPEIEEAASDTEFANYERSYGMSFSGDRTTWPKLKPWLLRIVENVEPSHRRPQIDAGARTLTVFLPKAAVVEVSLGCLISAKDLNILGVWHWIDEALPEHKEKIRKVILRGLYQVVTPVRQIRLIHAVQQPLFEPKLVVGGDAQQEELKAQSSNPSCALLIDQSQKFGVQSCFGDSFAQIRICVELPAKSAEKYVVNGMWQDMVDDRSKPKWEWIRTSAQIFDFTTPTPCDVTRVIFGKHDFADTKRHEVTYNVTAFTRFQQYFVPGTSPTTRVSKPFTLDIPNRAVPAPPSIAYVVPVFGWSGQKVDGPSTELERLGGGLRIYLHRPWYVSGIKELLGVVVVPTKQSAAPNGVITSQWGADPIWETAGISHELSAEDVGDISPEAIWGYKPSSGDEIKILGYPVEYNEERQLWYADVAFDPGDARTPFVRLALTRFQPNSVPGAHISQTVVADFAQLTSTRSASIVLYPTDPSHISVRLDGPGFTGRNKVSVSVERQRCDLDESLSWIPTGIDDIDLLYRADEHGWHWETERPITLPLESAELRPIHGTGCRHRFRVNIKEFELFDSDAADGGRTKRLVFAGVIYL